MAADATQLGPADLAALGHLPSASAQNQEWDGCGCCGWCTIEVSCSCGWHAEVSGTMTHGTLDNFCYDEAWQSWATNHEYQLTVSAKPPAWFDVAQ
jgi:hypothetical protein